MVSLTPEPQPQSGAAALIKDSDATRFMTDVVQASREVPVLVDFWAPWCGPCRQLSPMLEKAVTAAAGKLRLVKINVDEPVNQPLAQQLRIQSIPAVYAFHNGQPVDGFLGALPEGQIKQFLDRILAAAGGGAAEGELSIEDALKEAEEMMAAGNAAEAEQIFADILEIEPTHPKGLAGLARLAIAAGDLAAAEARLGEIAPEHENDADVTRARAALNLARESGEAGDLAELKAKVAQNPNDLSARFDLAVALTGSGETEAAVNELLELIRCDRAWNEEAARKQLLKLFEALGPTDPLTLLGRRQLSSILFS